MGWQGAPVAYSNRNGMRAGTLISLVDRAWWSRCWRKGRELARQQDFLLLAAVVGTLLLVWAFIGVASEVFEGDTDSFDRMVLIALRNSADPSKVIGPPIVTEMMRDLTALGGVVVIAYITLAVAGFLVLARKPRALIAMLLASGGGILMSQLLKGLYARPRPDVVPQLSYVSTSSFPSGHSALSAIVYLTLGAMLARLVNRPMLRIYIIGNAILLTFAVGVSRVMLGVHYPTDVLAGWTVGAAWALGCWAVMRALQRRNAVEKPQGPKQAT